MTAPLEDYALIGDRQTASLVCRNGSIDWLCWPRFDSDACFAALLGRSDNGRWLIAPEQPAQIVRRYQTDTMILETDHEAEDWAVRVIDFMPPQQGQSAVVRQVIGLRGIARMQLELDLRFDYGKIPPWTEPTNDGFIGRIGPDLVILRGTVPLAVRQGGASSRFAVAAGDRVTFTLQHGDACADTPATIDTASGVGFHPALLA